MRERNKEQLVRGFVVVVGSSVTNTNSYAQKKSRSKRKSVVDKNFTESVKLARADKSWAWKIAIACDGSQQETQDTVFHGRCSRISECGRLGVARAKVRRFEEFRSQQAGWKSRWSSLEDKKKDCANYTVCTIHLGQWPRSSGIGQCARARGFEKSVAEKGIVDGGFGLTCWMVGRIS